MTKTTATVKLWMDTFVEIPVNLEDDGKRDLDHEAWKTAYEQFERDPKQFIEQIIKNLYHTDYDVQIQIFSE